MLQERRDWFQAHPETDFSDWTLEELLLRPAGQPRRKGQWFRNLALYGNWPGWFFHTTYDHYMDLEEEEEGEGEKDLADCHDLARLCVASHKRWESSREYRDFQDKFCRDWQALESN